MADYPQTNTPKRTREEEETLCIFEGVHEDPKRPKTYNDYDDDNNNDTKLISSCVEDEEEKYERNHQDFSDIFTTLQQELLSCEGEPLPFSSDSSEYSEPHGVEEEDDEKFRVMRHLLEASDDELGLPNSGVGGGDGEMNGGDLPFTLNGGLWELEDEAANYYAMLQAELFI